MRVGFLFIILLFTISCEEYVFSDVNMEIYDKSYIEMLVTASYDDNGEILTNTGGFSRSSSYFKNYRPSLFLNESKIEIKTVSDGYDYNDANRDVTTIYYDLTNSDVQYDASYQLKMNTTFFEGAYQLFDTLSSPDLGMPSPFRIIECDFDTTTNNLFVNWESSDNFNQYLFHAFSYSSSEYPQYPHFQYSDITSDTVKTINIDYSFDNLYVYVLAINGPMFAFHWYHSYDSYVDYNSILDWMKFPFGHSNVMSSNGAFCGYFNTVFYDYSVIKGETSN